MCLGGGTFLFFFYFSLDLFFNIIFFQLLIYLFIFVFQLSVLKCVAPPYFSFFILFFHPRANSNFSAAASLIGNGRGVFRAFSFTFFTFNFSPSPSPEKQNKKDSHRWLAGGSFAVPLFTFSLDTVPVAPRRAAPTGCQVQARHPRIYSAQIAFPAL